jgi:hypothetical protein
MNKMNIIHIKTHWKEIKRCLPEGEKIAQDPLGLLITPMINNQLAL